MTLLGQLVNGKRISIENDCMLAVICNFGHKTNKAVIKATNQLYDIIEKELILNEINYDEYDIKIEARQVINAYMNR
jgi:hypothetical protein